MYGKSIDSPPVSYSQKQSLLEQLFREGFPREFFSREGKIFFILTACAYYTITMMPHQSTVDDRSGETAAASVVLDVRVALPPARFELDPRPFEFRRPFQVVVLRDDDLPSIDLRSYLCRRAIRRAVDAASDGPERWTIGIESAAVVDGGRLAVPQTADDVRRVLRRLRGRTHQIATAVAVADRQDRDAWVEVVSTVIWMRALTD